MTGLESATGGFTVAFGVFVVSPNSSITATFGVFVVAGGLGPALLSSPTNSSKSESSRLSTSVLVCCASSDDKTTVLSAVRYRATPFFSTVAVLLLFLGRV